MESDWRWNVEVVGLGGVGPVFTIGTGQVTMTAQPIPPYVPFWPAGMWIAKVVRPSAPDVGVGYWLLPNDTLYWGIWPDSLGKHFPYGMTVPPDSP